MNAACSPGRNGPRRCGGGESARGVRSTVATTSQHWLNALEKLLSIKGIAGRARSSILLQKHGSAPRMPRRTASRSFWRTIRCTTPRSSAHQRDSDRSDEGYGAFDFPQRLKGRRRRRTVTRLAYCSRYPENSGIGSGAGCRALPAIFHVASQSLDGRRSCDWSTLVGCARWQFRM